MTSTRSWPCPTGYLVMYEGAIIGSADPRTASREEIGMMMAGSAPVPMWWMATRAHGRPTGKRGQSHRRDEHHDRARSQGHSGTRVRPPPPLLRACQGHAVPAAHPDELPRVSSSRSGGGSTLRSTSRSSSGRRSWGPSRRSNPAPRRSSITTSRRMPIEGSLSVIARACAEVGVRVVCAYGVTGRHGSGWREARTRGRMAVLSEGGRGLVGIDAAFTCSDGNARGGSSPRG